MVPPVVDEEMRLILSGELSVLVRIESPVGDVSIETSGLFDETSTEINPDTGASIVANIPRVSIYMGQSSPDGLKNVETGWLVSIAERRYRVRSVENIGYDLVCYKLKYA